MTKVFVCWELRSVLVARLPGDLNRDCATYAFEYCVVYILMVRCEDCDLKPLLPNCWVLSKCGYDMYVD